MKSSIEFLSIFFEFLNQKGEYAVLRNYEGLPEKNYSRDIDIVIESSTYNRLKAQLIELVEAAGWKIVIYLNSDRLITWVCGCIRESGSTEMIQFDFFFHTSVFGIHLLEARDILRHKEFNGAVYHANLEYQFLDKYMYNRAIGATYPEKYKHIKESIQHNKMVCEVLNSTFGTGSVAQCDKISGKKLLWQAFKRHPFLSLLRFVKFEYHRIRNYTCSNTGFCMGFTGPDGSGKTTIINLLLEQIAPIFKNAYKYYHFRPTLFGNLGEVMHSSGLKKEIDREYDKPHRGGKTGLVSSFIRLLYYTTDYIAGYFIKIKTQIRLTRIVIFDRYYTDIICDSRRSRIYLNTKFLYCWGRLFIPSLKYNILLTATTETILCRKQELDAEGIETINRKIDFLSNKKDYIKVMNETSPKEAVLTIFTHVFENQHKLNTKRLKNTI